VDSNAAQSDQPVSIRWGTPVARGVLVTTILGSGMAMLDGTVVNVALPRIGKELEASVAGLNGSSTGTCCRSRR